MKNDSIDEWIGLAFILGFLALAIFGLTKKDYKKDYKVEPIHNTAKCIEYDKGIFDGRIEFIDLNPHWVSKSILPKCKKWDKRS